MHAKRKNARGRVDTGRPEWLTPRSPLDPPGIDRISSAEARKSRRPDVSRCKTLEFPCYPPTQASAALADSRLHCFYFPRCHVFFFTLNRKISAHLAARTAVELFIRIDRGWAPRTPPAESPHKTLIIVSYFPRDVPPDRYRPSIIPRCAHIPSATIKSISRRWNPRRDCILG